MKFTFKRTLVALAVAASVSPAAHATNGYFSHGFGTKSKALAGAGVALPQDSLAAATNPAGEVWVGDRMDLGIALFSPRREYNSGASGGGATLQNAFGGANAIKSDHNYFLIPNFGRNWMLNNDSSFSVAVFGNGGMNTDYKAPGPFGGGKTGVDLMQLFVAPTYSRKINASSSWGVSAILAAQRFKAVGLSNFAGFSSSPGNLTNRGYEMSYGAGLRIGWQGEVASGLTLGAAYTTKISMTKFDKYKGLFAQDGGFDIPASATVGLAWKTTPTSVLALDVQWINYNGVDAIANTITPLTTSCTPGAPATGPGCLGASNGAGFGWRNMTIVKLGYQWESSPKWTWRVGVSHGRQPIPDSEVMFNILAPGVMETHVTGGFTMKMGKTSEFSMAAMYAPEKTVSGNAPAALGGMPIELKMKQFEVEASWGWRF
jgi:long-chain fatty acid transport protein